MMLQLELPHINVLSKIDLIERNGKLPFNLEYYTDVLDLSYLINRMEDEGERFTRKYCALNKAICELIEDYSLVSFYTLNIEDKESVFNLIKAIDKANGFVFTTYLNETSPNSDLKWMSLAYSHSQWDFERSAVVQERYFKDEEVEEGDNRDHPQ
jgi:hypothetical protein